MADEFSDELKQFVGQNIESLAQLESLILMREDSDHYWSPEEISKTLYIPREMAKALLTDLARRGFLQVEHPAGERYRFHVSNSATQQLIGEVTCAYQQRRVALISLIYSKPLNKVQTFADAFRLRKEKE